MSSIASLAGESPESKGKADDSQSIPDGDESRGFDGKHGESQGLADLLAESDESKPESESKETPGDRLIDLAEKLGKKPEDLYALTVALSDGKTLKIGELKDIAQKATDFEAGNLELETRRQEQEAKFTRMHGELRELVGELPKAALNQEAFTKAAEKYQAKVEEARQATEAAIPEWKEADVKKAERTAMAEFLGDYGFGADYLDSVIDPRSMRFIRDAWRLNKRVKDALAKVKKVAPDKKPSGHTPSGSKKPIGSKSSATTPVSKQYSELLDS